MPAKRTNIAHNLIWPLIVSLPARSFSHGNFPYRLSHYRCFFDAARQSRTPTLKRSGRTPQGVGTNRHLPPPCHAVLSRRRNEGGSPFYPPLGNPLRGCRKLPPPAPLNPQPSTANCSLPTPSHPLIQERTTNTETILNPYSYGSS